MARLQTSSDSITTDQTNDVVLKLTVSDGEYTQIRMVQLDEIFDHERNKPVYWKLMDRLILFIGREINPNFIKLSYQVGNEEIVLGSTTELEYAIRQSGDVEMIAFVATVKDKKMGMTTTPAPMLRASSADVNCAAPAAVLDPNGLKTPPTTVPTTASTRSSVPVDLANHDGVVEFPTVRFDTSCTHEGLVFSNPERCVIQNANNGGYKSVYAKEGFESGCHYWSFQPIGTFPHWDIAIGVGNASGEARKFDFPGYGGHPGCSLFLWNSNFCESGKTCYATPTDASLVQGATTIGVLLDMDHKTVTFYADGSRVGMIKDVLTATKYYPVVALAQRGESVVVEDTSSH